MHIPPILRQADFVGVETREKDVIVFIFRSVREYVGGDGYIHIHVYSNRPVYEYALRDTSTNTVTFYRGTSGDPAKDKVTRIVTPDP